MHRETHELARRLAQRVEGLKSAAGTAVMDDLSHQMNCLWRLIDLEHTTDQMSVARGEPTAELDRHEIERIQRAGVTTTLQGDRFNTVCRMALRTSEAEAETAQLREATRQAAAFLLRGDTTAAQYHLDTAIAPTPPTGPICPKHTTGGGPCYCAPTASTPEPRDA